jgi:hypothetical protein
VSQKEQTFANASLTPTPLSNEWGVSAAYFLLNRTPLGNLVRWVAGIKTSVHIKLVTGFFIVTLLFIAMGGLSLQAIVTVSLFKPFSSSTRLVQELFTLAVSRQIRGVQVVGKSRLSLKDHEFASTETVADDLHPQQRSEDYLELTEGSPTRRRWSAKRFGRGVP